MADSMAKIARAVLDELEELVGCPAEGVTGVRSKSRVTYGERRRM